MRTATFKVTRGAVHPVNGVPFIVTGSQFCGVVDETQAETEPMQFGPLLVTGGVRTGNAIQFCRFTLMGTEFPGQGDILFAE
ncbi:MAG: hypothetical protein AAFV19_11425 [Pseudomonadota bacterium]